MIILDLYMKPIPPTIGTDYSLSPVLVAGLAVVLLGLAAGAVLATRRAWSRDSGASEGGPETGPIPIAPDDPLQRELDALLEAQGGEAHEPGPARRAEVRTPADVH